MINYLNVIVVAISLIGLIVIFLYIDLLSVILKSKKYFTNSKKRKGFADLLNYAAVCEDGIIVCKDGSFIASWEYQCPDTASSTNAEQEQLSALINMAIKDLGTGWIFSIDSVRTITDSYSNKNESHFPDQISQAIDNERRAYFNQQEGNVFEGRNVLTVIWTPPLLAQQKVSDLMFTDYGATKKTKHDLTYGLLEKFNQEIDVLERKLSIAFKLKRLRSEKVFDQDGNTITVDHQLEHLNFCITGKNQPIQLPSQPMYLDAIIGGHDFFATIIPMVDDQYINVINIEGFPNDSYPGILNLLSELPCEYRWNTRFIFLDETQSIPILDQYMKKWRQKTRGFFAQLFDTANARIDLDAVEMMNDAEEAIAEVKGNYVSAGFYTSTIILYDRDREKLKTVQQHIQRQINKLGFATRLETINATSAFLDSLPGHYHNLRQPILNTLNLADLIPTNTIWVGEKYNPNPMYPPHSPALMYCLTNGSTPFRLNVHVRDLGHTFIFGPTGSGKSTLLATLAAQLRRYQGMRIYSFDKGLSMYPLTKACGGQHFSLGADDSQLNFCPLQFLETKSDQAWAAEWIENILQLNNVQITPQQRNLISEAIKSMHDSHAQTITDFTNTIQDNAIRETLKPYTIDGQLGHLLDADQDGLKFSDFCTFEIEDLMNLSPKYCLPVILYLFRRIEKSLDGKPSVIFLDEAWLMLGNDVFREKIKEWLKVLRKANCAVIMATQSLSDAANSGILDVITESTATKIFLANIYAKEEQNIPLYRGMGLNDRQIEIISQMIPKRQYYYVSEKGRRLFELALGSLTLSFVGATDKESIARMKELMKSHGDDWPRAWLEERNIKLENYLG